MTEEEENEYFTLIDDDTDSPYFHEWSNAEIDLQIVLEDSRFKEFMKDNDLLKNLDLDTVADENSPINAFFEGLVGWLNPDEFDKAIAALTRIGRARSVFMSATSGLLMNKDDGGRK